MLNMSYRSSSRFALVELVRVPDGGYKWNVAADLYTNLSISLLQ